MENESKNERKNMVIDENTQRPYYIDPEAFDMEKVLSSDSPIKEFKKLKGRNLVHCVQEDGKEHIIPVDQYIQLFYDKMEMNPDIKVDFGKRTRDKVMIFPFQNKIIYIDGITGKIKKSLPIDSNLIYDKNKENDKNHENKEDKENDLEIDSRLNPAVLSILDAYKEAQNDYVNATGDIDIIYDFETKSEKFLNNISNHELARKMNKYYESEKEYVKESNLENEISKKVGYANTVDKIKSFFGKQKNKFANSNKKTDNSFKDKRNKFLKKYSESDNEKQSFSKNVKEEKNNDKFEDFER